MNRQLFKPGLRSLTLVGAFTMAVAQGQPVRAQVVNPTAIPADSTATFAPTSTTGSIPGLDLGALANGGWGSGPGSILNGDLSSILNGGGLGGILNGDLSSILNGGGLGGILNGDLSSILNSGGLGSILNGDLGSILNGDLGSILNGGGLGGILNGNLGGILNGGWGGTPSGGGLGGILTGGGGSNNPLGDILNAGGGSGGGAVLGPGGLFGGGAGAGHQANVNIRTPTLVQGVAARSPRVATAAGRFLDNIRGGFGAPPEFITGSLGVPDVLASQLALTEAIVSGAENGSPGAASQRVDRFNMNPIALADTASKEVSRAAAAGFANSLLSEEGQEAIVAEVKATDDTLQEIVVLAEEAQGLDVTQDIMKSQIAALAQSSAIDVAQYGQSIQMRQQLAADSLVQIEAARELSALNRAQSRQGMAQAAEVINSSAGLVLFQ
ncbi:hypothetical protein IQ265_25030 [Nodosilinea sp. LEGE 06152]|uniref:hypothetical protein n=1 Tax=Nodosilinea sp. LEGE 06152 TaxID=2777966 RepID=UPI001881AE35|nr:hypothetical protein [Nodosilinea sp. LEGE 06152]MBE9160063.1 hypothetical protein [Nodosilinea sp. LEGE 06152]